MTSQLSNGHGGQTFRERNNRDINVGEQRFINYCVEKNVKYHRLGFDEKHGQFGAFYRVNPVLRFLPDFITETPGGNLSVVEVKGSAKFKESAFARIDWMVDTYSTSDCRLWFAFCLPDRMKWLTPDGLKTLFQESTDCGVWDDGVKFRKLDI